MKPLRSVAIFGAVGALVAAVALPAYASTSAGGVNAAASLQEIAQDDAQSLVVASEVVGDPLDRGVYTATSADEIAEKKAQEAAAAAAAAAASSGGSRSYNIDLSMVAPGSGEVRWPVNGGSLGDGLGAGRNHQGLDMFPGEGTPIFAAASGVVTTAQNGYGGYGTAVVIMHNLGGQAVETTYAHMISGSYVVSPGQYVNAGQVIGLVGNTGNSYGAHLHFEVRVNGGLVEPLNWLNANAG